MKAARIAVFGLRLEWFNGWGQDFHVTRPEPVDGDTNQSRSADQVLEEPRAPLSTPFEDELCELAMKLTR